MRPYRLFWSLLAGLLPFAALSLPAAAATEDLVRMNSPHVLPVASGMAGDAAQGRGALQRTHRMGADPGMAALRRFLGVGARFEHLARTAAEKAYGSHDISTAVPLLYAAHVLAPRDALTLRRLGFAAKSAGYYEIACDALRHAALLSPDEFEVWWWLADTERLLGYYEDALEHMRRAQELAPQEESRNLLEFVEYSELLADPTPSWDTFYVHRDFAGRHQDTRRIRRAAAEYQEALARLPEFDASDSDAWARVAWTFMQMGYQYAYLQEHETAIFYFERCAGYYERTGTPEDTGRCLNNAADSYAVLAATGHSGWAALLDRAIERREQALALNRHAGDPEQGRYTMGRLLEALLARDGLEHPRVAELRQYVINDLPWTGPIEEFSLVAAAEAEAACRIAEGDLGGARQLLERIRPYLEASQFLEDTFRIARLDTLMARIHQQQGHVGAAIQAGRRALVAVAQVRGYLHAEAFMRSEAAVIQRHAHGAVVRSAISSGDFTSALAASEEYRTAQLSTLLGSAALGEAHFADLGLEVELARARLDEIAAARAEVEAHAQSEFQTGKGLAALDWLAEHEKRDRALLERLRARPETGDSMPMHHPGASPVLPGELRDAVAHDALYLSYIVDPWGACAITVSNDGIGGILLDEATEALLLENVAAFQQAVAEGGDTAAPLALLAAVLLEPLASELGERRLLIAPDHMLHGVPFAALPLNGGYLVDKHDLGMVLGGNQLLHSRPSHAPAGVEAVLCRADEGGSEAMLFGEAADAQPPLVYVEAPVDLWEGEVPLSAILLAPGGGFDGRLHFAEIAARTLPPVAMLCLGAGWPPAGATQNAVQALAHALLQAGAATSVFNLWNTGGCTSLQHLATAGLEGNVDLCAWQRAQIASGVPVPVWSALVAYGAHP